MKKSYDYFKTLKDLSRCVKSYYEKCVLDSDCEKDVITFSGEKSELISNLQNEFIAPLERGDIFALVNCLSEEMCAVGILKEYSALSGKEFDGLKDSVGKCFEMQERIFSSLSKKDLSGIYTDCVEFSAKTERAVKEIQNKIRLTVLCSSESRPLLKYAVFACFLGVAESLKNTSAKLQSAVLNNS